MAENRAWRDRVVAREPVDPRVLVAHPDNWRAHPDAQKDVMIGAIRELGFVGDVKVSKRSGRILDGHMRVALAIADGQSSIPVAWIDCESDEEEARILASYDPIASLAELDAERFGRVLERAQIEDDPLRTMLTGLLPPPTETVGLRPGVETAPDTSPVALPEVWGVVIECPDEQTQVALLERLADEGYTARALMS